MPHRARDCARYTAYTLTATSVATAANWSLGGDWPHPLWMYLSWLGMAICWLGYFILLGSTLIVRGINHTFARQRDLDRSNPPPAPPPPKPRGGLSLVRNTGIALAGAAAATVSWLRAHPVGTAVAVTAVVAVTTLPSGVWHGENPERWIAPPAGPPMSLPEPPQPTPSTPPPPAPAPVEPLPEQEPPADEPLTVIDDVEPVGSQGPATPPEPPPASPEPEPATPTPPEPTPEPAPEPAPEPPPTEEPSPAPEPGPRRCLVGVHLGQLLDLCIGATS